MLRLIRTIQNLSFSSLGLSKCFTLFFLVMTPALLHAQQALSLREAVSIAFEKNHGLIAVDLKRKQAEMQNTAGEAGMLPSVRVQGGYEKDNLDLQQRLADGRVIERNSASSSFLSGSATLTWTLFDGMAMFIRKDRLGSMEEEARLTQRLQMEATIVQLVSAYFALRTEEDQILALKELLQVDSVRVSLAAMRLKSGSGSKPELLQASIEQNLHKAQLIARLSARQAEQENLNLLLGRDPAVAVTTTDSIVLSDVGIDQDSQAKDAGLLLARQQKVTAMQAWKESKAGRYPSLSFQSGYAFSRNENEAGFLLRNQNTGPGYGLLLSWILFDGRRTDRMIRRAELDIKLAENLESELFNLRKRSEQKAVREYRDRRETVKLEEASVKMADENLQIVLERLRSGLANSLEIQEAERLYQDSMTRLSLARYQAKLAETELLRLRGDLILESGK
jgi:outer membrane protein TolC